LAYLPLLTFPLILMDIKYLSDAKGTITGVFIPIEEWEQLKKQYKITEEAQPESGTKLQKGLANALKNVKLDDSDE
jgi:hypothetical protein